MHLLCRRTILIMLIRCRDEVTTLRTDSDIGRYSIISDLVALVSLGWNLEKFSTIDWSGSELSIGHLPFRVLLIREDDDGCLVFLSDV